MKTLSIFVLVCCSLHAAAQTREEGMINRAREFHRVFTQNDKDQWRKFIKENYTKAFLERPMKVQVSDDGGAAPAASEANKTDPVEGKLMMFERLNADFPGGKIGSVKQSGDEVEMVVSSDNGMAGTFKFRFDKAAPYLIDAIGVRVGN